MKAYLSLALYLLCAVTGSSNLFGQVQFGMRQFCCDQTTEHGADEVYLLILGERSDGKTVFELKRSPGPRDHWDMNDGDQGNDNPGGDSHCITNRGIASFALPEGMSYAFTIMVCEEDGGTSEMYQRIAQELLEQSEDPYALTAAAILEMMRRFGLHFTDTDDYMGIFGLKVYNQGGRITTDWRAKDGIVHLNPDPDHSQNGNRKEIRMNHDGSNYVAWFYVTQ